MTKTRVAIVLVLSFAAGCAPNATEAPARIEPEQSGGRAPQLAPRAPDARAAEMAPFAVEGDVVRVNNSICAVSRSAMAPETLGQFVSRVEYRGGDPRFRGKVFEFNQCCGGCVQRFPQMWAERADEILAYHGVAQRAERLQ